MTTPRVTEVPLMLEPVAPDPFVKDLERPVRPAAPTRAPAPPRLARPAAAATRRRRAARQPTMTASESHVGMCQTSLSSIFTPTKARMTARP